MNNLDPTWLDELIIVCVYHQKQLNLDPAHSQLQTAQDFDLSPKTVSMFLSVFPFVHEPEIKNCLGLRGAYAAILQRRKDKKDQLLERLFL